MVVMAIMALMSTLGILAMVGINNNVIADKIAEGVLTQIREAQNKALSVASEPIDPNIYPLAWGVKLVAGSGNDMVNSYYINDSFRVNIMDSENDQSIYTLSLSKNDGTVLADNTLFLNYSAPFGKYTLEDSKTDKIKTEPCWNNNISLGCVQEGARPRSINFDAAGKINESIKVVIDFRGVKKEIIIGENGEAVKNG